MSRLLTEIYIAEAYTQRLPIQPTKNDKAKNDTLKRFYACIFSENNTTETEFKKSINWYKSHPDLLDSVYQQTLSDLAVLQSRVNSSRQH